MKEMENNVFDHKAKDLNQRLFPLFVRNIDISCVGDIKITLEDGVLLDVFCVSSIPGEFWRAFKRGDIESHIVYSHEAQVV